ncbi:DUF2486 family protein [Paraburkholderia kururiensis]|uniref:DUF2486 family protein n=1 Tax=Paraburkholderia kururiensis TaxID=984307 RepID=A0ABZ0WHY6_9BURK|nr:DUF2486 family protein [Paraburkholderia kururiensis]WQD76976.1 DUF2486 family protein [Paraburkholderia kururiensis]
MSNHDDTSIPMLDDVVVPGKPEHARATPPHGLPDAFVPAAGAAVDEPLEPSAMTGFTTHVDDVVEPRFMEPSLGEIPVLSERLDEPAGERASVQPDENAEHALIERLRGRCMDYLTGEGRGLIEARCREAMQEHANWLVGTVVREVALALETEIAGWVKEAVEAVREERAHQSAPADRPGPPIGH